MPRNKRRVFGLGSHHFSTPPHLQQRTEHSFSSLKSTCREKNPRNNITFAASMPLPDLQGCTLPILLRSFRMTVEENAARRARGRPRADGSFFLSYPDQPGCLSLKVGAMLGKTATPAAPAPGTTGQPGTCPSQRPGKHPWANFLVQTPHQLTRM